MKTKLFFKLFLGTAIPAVLIFGALLAVCGFVVAEVSKPQLDHANAALLGAAIGIGVAVIFSLVLSIVLWWVQLYVSGDPRVHHCRRLVITSSLENVERICIDAMVLCNARPQINRKSGRVTLSARTGISLHSWGENISCTITSRADASNGVTPPPLPGVSQECEHTIDVESRPWWKSACVDYGVNLNNVRRMTSQLEQHGASHVVLPD